MPMHNSAYGQLDQPLNPLISLQSFDLRPLRRRVQFCGHKVTNTRRMLVKRDSELSDIVPTCKCSLLQLVFYQ